MSPARAPVVPRPARVAAALLLAASCRGPPRQAVDAVTIAEAFPLSHLEELGLSREALRTEAAAALAAAGFAVAPAEAPAGARHYRASFAILVARPVRRGSADGLVEPSEARMEVVVELVLSPAGGEEGALRQAGRWSEPVRAGDARLAALRRAVAGAARQGAAELMLGLAEANRADREVIADLQAGDSRVRDHAVRVLADRKNPAAVPALIARLDDPDPEIVERAVGALAQIRDPRAVEPLIELTHRKEGPFVAQLAHIIGDIGGADAEAYLLTLSSGHPEPMVRRAAAEALGELRGRLKEEPGPTASRAR